MRKSLPLYCYTSYPQRVSLFISPLPIEYNKTYHQLASFYKKPINALHRPSFAVFTSHCAGCFVPFVSSYQAMRTASVADSHWYLSLILAIRSWSLSLNRIGVCAYLFLPIAQYSIYLLWGWHIPTAKPRPSAGVAMHCAIRLSVVYRACGVLHALWMRSTPNTSPTSYPITLSGVPSTAKRFWWASLLHSSNRKSVVSAKRTPGPLAL
jgi:hypothetical protein